MDGLIPQSLRNKIYRYLKEKQTLRGVLDFGTIKRQVRDAMAGHTQGNRVDALLKDPAVTKAMDAALQQLFDPKNQPAAFPEAVNV